MKYSIPRSIFISLILTSCSATAANLDSSALTVEVDSAFPRIIQYLWKSGGAVLYGQEDSLNTIIINGTSYQPAVTFSQTTSTASYTLSIGSIGVSLAVTISVENNVVNFNLTQITETSSAKVRTLEFPNHCLISVRSSQPGAQQTAARLWGWNQWADEFNQLSSQPESSTPVGASYLFLNTNQLAASLESNTIFESAIPGTGSNLIDRYRYQVVNKGSYKRCGGWNSPWIYREIDSEIIGLPQCRIVISADNNNDGTVDWQDAAIGYRNNMTLPSGATLVRNSFQHAVMNIGSLGQHSYLQMLDNIKRVSLFTDNFQQMFLIKGHASEGHDSGHPDFANISTRAGSVAELNSLISVAQNYNCKVGVHINETTAFPEATAFSWNLVTGPDYYGFDQGYFINRRYDILSGGLYARLDELKTKAPDLSWIYVDVYSGNGWDAWKLGRKLNTLGWSIATEYSCVLERDAVWCYSTAFHSTLGNLNSRIVRFVRNHVSDTFYDGDPLLKGKLNLGCMGYDNDNIYDLVWKFNRTVLPTKFMQNFAIRKWSTNRIDFEGNVYVANESGVVNLYRNNRKIASNGGTSAGYEKSFIPWDPVTENRIYHWNSAGGSSTWQLPASWSTLTTVKLYRLTDLGKQWVSDLPVASGSVTINATANTPYVLTKTTSASPAITWGEGGLIRDPGFNSNTFTSWTVTSSQGSTGHVGFEIEPQGRRRLLISGTADADLTQTLSGLTTGKTYVVSAWVKVENNSGGRTATLRVKNYGGPEVVNNVRKTDVENRDAGGDYYWSTYQRIKLYFELASGTSATIALQAGPATVAQKVWFDDISIREAVRPNLQGNYFLEDFENVDQGWGPFVYTSRDGTWSNCTTHLANRNGSYTPEVITGNYSLKTVHGDAGLVYRTIPATLRLQPNTTYRVTFNYISQNSNQFSLIAASRTAGEQAPALLTAVPSGQGAFTANFTTGAQDDFYLGIVKNFKTSAEDMFVLDNFAVNPTPCLLSNSGFETGSLAGWTAKWNPALAWIETNYPRSGMYDASLHPTATQDVALSQTFIAPNTRTYTLQAYVATNITNGVTLGVNVAGSNAAQTILPANTSYTQKSLVFNASAGQTIEVWHYASNKPGWATIDDVWLTAGPLNGSYRMIVKHSGKAVEVANWSTADGGLVDQWSYLGGANQRWQIESTGDGCYRLTNVNSGKVMQVQNASLNDATAVVQSTYLGADHQKWSIQETGGGYFRILARHSGKALDVSGGSTANGAGLLQWPATGADNQCFQFLAP